MKRIAILIIIAMTLTTNIHINAQSRQQVTREEATRVAQRLLIHPSNNTHTAPYVQMAERRDSIGNVILYEVTIDSISVLLSGSKACYPLLGKYFAPNGPLLHNYDNLPDNIRWIFDGYISQITPCFHNDTIRLYHNNNWNNLIEGTNLSNRNGEEHTLDFTSMWKQKGCNNSNEIGYEYYIPTIDSDACFHSSAGCGAVALGQVLYYWKHPVSTNWEKKYDWCNMTDMLVDTSPTFQKNREATARLLKDCATSITTSWGCEQSFSNFNDIPVTLINGFDYSSTAHVVQRSNNNENWENIIVDQIDRKLPIIYGGGGHTFVCYGYSVNPLGSFWIMVNMGNGTIGNGWYSLDNISFYNNVDGHTYDFNNEQSAIIDIYPNNYISLCDRNVELDDYYRPYQNEISNGTYPPWEIPPATVTNLTSASINSPALWRTIPTGAISTYKAQVSITLKGGFSAKSGAEFVAKIEPCVNCGNSRSSMCQREVSQMDENIGQNGRNDPTGEPLDEFQSKSLIFYADNDSEHNINVYPNPTEGQVAVEIPQMTEGKVSIQIIDIFGRQVMECHEDAATSSYRKTIDASSLPSGCYYVVVTANESRNIKCIIKQ